ncbi:tyrosine-type recombinase/integrase [Sphingomonas sp.]|uniref:tyrosine-type recombinase/integrase n=1 Tax=Sphingomonas sp. TaxID=28214 RepID=UPI003AFF7DD2
MATERLPSYVNVRRLAGGKRAYYWIRPAWADPRLADAKDEKVRARAVRHGRTCPVISTALGTELSAAIAKADVLNATFAEWREGSPEKPTTGTIRWLFDWYRRHERFTGLRHASRAGYRIAMDAVDAIEMRTGTFGLRQAAAVDAAAADTLYRKAREKHGERQGAYMMQVCRLVWNQAVRYGKATGVKANPFSGMGIKASSGAGRGNRAATRAEYDAYRAKARELGRQSMATAAALCFEGCQRVTDAFGFVDPDGHERGIRWSGYRPGGELRLIQSKTGNAVEIPLTDTIGGEVVALYPELEEEMARTDRPDDPEAMIVRDERTGQPYTSGYAKTLHRRIRDAAGLPKDLRFTSFRHGGLTEIGDSGEADVRAISGHSTLEVTRIYNKANTEKAKRIAAARREHIGRLTAGAEEAAEAEPAL